MKANWIDHALSRNCFLKPAVEGKIEGAERRGRRIKQLLDDRKETRSWKLKEEVNYSILWKNGFGRDYGPLVRQTMW
jgi:hypothetical protein